MANFSIGDRVLVGRGATVYEVREVYRVDWDLGPRIFADLRATTGRRWLYTVAVETMKRTRRKR